MTNTTPTRPEPTTRRCVECHRPIALCNGFVLSRDFVDALAGSIPWKWARELCGLCVLKRDHPEWIRSAPADELERLLSAVSGAHPQAVNNIRAFFTTLAAQVRRDAREEAAKLCELKAADHLQESAGAIYANTERAVINVRCAATYEAAARAIRALSPSPVKAGGETP